MSVCIGGAIGEKSELAFGLIEEGKKSNGLGQLDKYRAIGYYPLHAKVKWVNFVLSIPYPNTWYELRCG
jgi:hypothetical protein